jgi:hypothetical protein
LIYLAGLNCSGQVRKRNAVSYGRSAGASASLFKTKIEPNRSLDAHRARLWKSTSVRFARKTRRLETSAGLVERRGRAFAVIDVPAVVAIDGAAAGEFGHQIFRDGGTGVAQ